MGALRSIGVVLIIVGMIFALFATLDPRLKTPVFEGKKIKYVAYREAVVTSGNATETYEQVVLLVTGRAQLPDTKVTISGTAFPITSGVVYYFSGYYFYMPTYYTTAKYMVIGPMTYTNVYTLYSEKYERVRRSLVKGGTVLIIIGLFVVVATSIKLPERTYTKEKREEVTVGEDEEDEFEKSDLPGEDYEEVEDIDIFIPPEN